MAENQKVITMGSLFDGIGGFPLAAVHNGIVPLWASEIEAFPIRVTKAAFPQHAACRRYHEAGWGPAAPGGYYLRRESLPGLSVAGARAGLSGARSGLFIEQIRIIKEMRDVDKRRGRTGIAVRPRFAVWENVLYALQHIKDVMSRKQLCVVPL